MDLKTFVIILSTASSILSKCINFIMVCCFFLLRNTLLYHQVIQLRPFVSSYSYPLNLISDFIEENSLWRLSRNLGECSSLIV